MSTKTDKILFLGMVPVCIIIAIIFTFIATTATYGPQALTEEQVSHYADVAESIWTKENIYKDPSLQTKRTKNSLTVYSYNMFQETVTVFFDEPTPKVIVNEPNINFTGCAIFFYTLTAVAAFGAIVFLHATIEEFRAKQPQT